MKSKIEDLVIDLAGKYPTDTIEQLSQRLIAAIKGNSELEHGLAQYVVAAMYAEDARGA